MYVIEILDDEQYRHSPRLWYAEKVNGLVSKRFEDASVFDDESMAMEIAVCDLSFSPYRFYSVVELQPAERVFEAFRTDGVDIRPDIGVPRKEKDNTYQPKIYKVLGMSSPRNTEDEWFDVDE